jgi:AcrR family transcriptional regulator
VARPADHDQRRRQLAEAVWRLAARSGLENVTLRQVAAEAGASARLIQYYFGTRDELLLGALEMLNADAERRAAERVAALGDDPGPRALLRAVLHELLPLDDERRTRHLVYAAYFVRFLTDPGLAAVARDAAPALETLVTGLITHAQTTGQVPAAIDPAAEGHFLLAATEGMQGGILLGSLSPELALNLLDHQLNRLFPKIP